MISEGKAVGGKEVLQELSRYSPAACGGAHGGCGLEAAAHGGPTGTNSWQSHNPQRGAHAAYQASWNIVLLLKVIFKHLFIVINKKLNYRILYCLWISASATFQLFLRFTEEKH